MAPAAHSRYTHTHTHTCTYELQASHYQTLPDTLDGVKAAVADMNLRHKLVAPPPSSVRWWVMTALLLVLGFYGVLIRAGMRGGFAVLRWLWPAAAVQLAAWQAAAAHLPWKHVVGVAGVDASHDAPRTSRAAENNGGTTQQLGGADSGTGGGTRHKKKKQQQQQQPAYAT